MGKEEPRPMTLRRLRYTFWDAVARLLMVYFGWRFRRTHKPIYLQCWLKLTYALNNRRILSGDRDRNARRCHTTGRRTSPYPASHQPRYQAVLEATPSPAAISQACLNLIQCPYHPSGSSLLALPAISSQYRATSSTNSPTSARCRVSTPSCGRPLPPLSTYMMCPRQ